MTPQAALDHATRALDQLPHHAPPTTPVTINANALRALIHHHTRPPTPDTHTAQNLWDWGTPDTTPDQAP